MAVPLGVLDGGENHLTGKHRMLYASHEIVRDRIPAAGRELSKRKRCLGGEELAELCVTPFPQPEPGHCSKAKRMP
jgi:hypothetical protein